MNKTQIKNELWQINNSLNLMDSQFIKIKTAFHNLEKMGFDMNEIYKMLDETGIPFYKLKTMSRDFIKEQLNEWKKEEI